MDTNASAPGVSPQLYALQSWKAEFGPPHPEPEGLHRDYLREKSHYALSQTQYFGFSIPQHNVHALLMLWHHPNLGVISGGPMVWRGKKKTQLACELLDYRNYMSDRILGAFKSYKLDNSYSVTVVDGGREFHFSYEDASRDNRFELTQVPVSERLYWPSGNHFEQVMRTKGDLVLRGKHYAIDGFHIRDRSWGENRLEDPYHTAPLAWSTGVFDESFAFNVTGMDDPMLGPIWKDRFKVESKDTLKFGWVIAEGVAAPLVRLRKITTFNASLFPETVKMELLDTRGREFQINGTITALSPHIPWPNCTVHICLTRWECNGKIGWGDHQEVQYTDILQGQDVDT